MLTFIQIAKSASNSFINLVRLTSFSKENKSNTEKEAIESPLFSIWRSIFLRLFNSDNTSELATVFGVFFKNKRDTVDVAGKEKIFNFTLNFTRQVRQV